MSAHERLRHYVEAHQLRCVIETPLIRDVRAEIKWGSIYTCWMHSGQVILTIDGRAFTAFDPDSLGAAMEVACQQALDALGVEGT